MYLQAQSDTAAHAVGVLGAGDAEAAVGVSELLIMAGGCAGMAGGSTFGVTAGVVAADGVELPSTTPGSGA